MHVKRCITAMATSSPRSLALLMIFMSSAMLCSHFDYAYGDDDGCIPIRTLVGTSSGACNSNDDSACCKDGDEYSLYDCSPPVTSPSTAARMTLNSFEEGGEGGAAAECDGNYHGDDEMVVALSTGWFDKCSRCSKNIQITSSSNGKTVTAMVVDECDSMRGCDGVHAFQKPCDNNVVDASRAVWNALGFFTNEEIWSNDQITWSDIEDNEIGECVQK